MSSSVPRIEKISLDKSVRGTYVAAFTSVVIKEYLIMASWLAMLESLNVESFIALPLDFALCASFNWNSN